MSVLFLILGLVLVLGGLAFLIKDTYSFVKNRILLRLEKKAFVKGIGYLVALAIGFCFLFLALFLAHPEWQNVLEHPSSSVYAGESVNYVGNYVLALLGGFVFGAALGLFIVSFWIHMFKEEIDPKQKRLFSLLWYLSIPALIGGIWMWSEGLADYLYYPLVNGISITGNGFEISTSRSNPGGFHVAFYGVIILLGALLCLFLGEQRIYKRYHKRGLMELIFVLAFPAGILGARIWYVVGNWSREFAHRDFYHVFEIWNGGLTILGGAFFGIFVGFLAQKYIRKNMDARWVADECVPTVLIGQAVGRWGNFFNNEVYGNAVSVNGWRWLPTWLVEQMHISTASAANPTAGAGQIYVPLFLIESCLSIAGYFLLQYGVGKALRKWTRGGDRVGGYFVWYGIVRMIMEPFRDTDFNMGTDNAWSICNSLIYILIGMVIIASVHLHDYYLAKKKAGFFPLISAIMILPTFLFPLLPSLTTSTDKDGTGTVISYQGYELLFGGKTPLFLTAFILIAAAMVCFVVSFFVLRKNQKAGFYTLLGATIVSFLGTVFYLVGKNANSFESSLYINLSYGFILCAAFALAASVFGLIYLRDTKKLEKAASNEETPKKEEVSHEAN